MRRWMIGSVVLVSLVALAAGFALAEDTPDGTVKLTEGSVALGIGWSWGKGELSYEGKTYKFKIGGLSAGEVGKSKAEASGKVFNLKSLDDFEGVYAAGSAGASAKKGEGLTALTNENGVSLLLKSETKGASLKLAAEGLKVKLEK